MDRQTDQWMDEVFYWGVCSRLKVAWKLIKLIDIEFQNEGLTKLSGCQRDHWQIHILDKKIQTLSWTSKICVRGVFLPRSPAPPFDHPPYPFACPLGIFCLTWTLQTGMCAFLNKLVDKICLYLQPSLEAGWVWLLITNVQSRVVYEVYQ
jgi:hypothetical protein